LKRDHLETAIFLWAEFARVPEEKTVKDEIEPEENNH